MPSWLDLEQAAPRIAGEGHALLGRARVAMLGTLRPDGSPRISPIEPYFTDGQLIFGAMTWSGKARDLRRDPRCVLHNAISQPDAGEAEVKLHGMAEAASTPLRDACRQAWWAGQPRMAADVFVLNVTQAVLIEWDLEHGQMTSTHWSPGHGLRQQTRNYP
jgi:Pyridoxamine 5'-phosphate oxidase